VEQGLAEDAAIGSTHDARHKDAVPLIVVDAKREGLGPADFLKGVVADEADVAQGGFQGLFVKGRPPLKFIEPLRRLFVVAKMVVEHLLDVLAARTLKNPSPTSLKLADASTEQEYRHQQPNHEGKKGQNDGRTLGGKLIKN
jgi:hypothetical protein